VNPRTKTNWEGHGVTPDHEATSETSFALAYRMALQHVNAQTRASNRSITVVVVTIVLMCVISDTTGMVTHILYAINVCFGVTKRVETFGRYLSNVRNVIVIDRDVNMHEPGEIQWALTNRVHWEDDVFTVPFAQGHEMDPTADKRGVSTKVGIDATYKRERREYGERVHYPPVDLGPYLG